MRLNDAAWSVWQSILKQMDAACRPSKGKCANCGTADASKFHIYCEPCRLAAGGYRFGRQPVR
jgi:hypothetical protein